jgi:ligand-binding sensor domain-containing protein
LARRGPEALIASVVAFLAAVSSFADGRTAAEVLAEARTALVEGDHLAAHAALRSLRSSFPADPLVADSYALETAVALSEGDPLRARAFVARLEALFPRTHASYDATLLVADWYHDRSQREVALAYYLEAIAAHDAGPDRTGLDRALLRAAAAESWLESDERLAREHFRAVQPAGLEGPDTELYRALRVRLAWERLGAERLGLTDANISSLAVDGDDLWVGTWNGGAARWSLSAEVSTLFPNPAYPRAFEPTARRVWVATFEGLASYARASARWSLVAELQEPSPAKVQALEAMGDDLYAGTLGDGLLRLRDGVWERVSSGGYPGRFVNCLAADGGRLLVGTMDLGLLVLDTVTGRFTSLAALHPAFTARNVTTVLPDRGRVWIGTYGEGLWLWEGDDILRFGRDTGEIGDDWVLASCRVADGVWFGTFGAGASFVGDDGRWRRLGVADGLPSLDVSAIAWRPPFLFLGTLGAGVCAYWEGADAPQP